MNRHHPHLRSQKLSRKCDNYQARNTRYRAKTWTTHRHQRSTKSYKKTKQKETFSKYFRSVDRMVCYGHYRWYL